MQRGKALLIYLIYICTTLYQLIYHYILTVVAGHMEGRVSISIRLIDLDGNRNMLGLSKITGREIIYVYYRKNSHQPPSPEGI